MPLHEHSVGAVNSVVRPPNFTFVTPLTCHDCHICHVSGIRAYRYGLLHNARIMQ